MKFNIQAENDKIVKEKHVWIAILTTLLILSGSIILISLLSKIVAGSLIITIIFEMVITTIAPKMLWKDLYGKMPLTLITLALLNQYYRYYYKKIKA